MPFLCKNYGDTQSIKSIDTIQKINSNDIDIREYISL